MRIVVFYKYFRTYGGQEKVVYDLVHYFARKGHNVDVYTFKVEDRPKYSNITVHKIWFPFKGGIRELFFAVYSYFKGKSIKKEYENVCIFGLGKTFYSDIYRADSGSHLYYFKRAKFKYATNATRIIYVIRKYLSLAHWVNIWIEYMNFKKLAKTKKVYVFPSEFTRKQVISQFGLDRSKTILIKNGVNLDRFKVNEELRAEMRSVYSIDDNEIAFCFVSTNHKLKGLYYLLKAVKTLKNKGFSFKLLIAGGNYEKYFKSRIHREGLEDYVICLGKVKEIERVYNACDVFVFPTLYDAAALVVLEAMACGLVPVVSKYNGTSEIVKNGENGFIIEDPTNVNEIANTMELLLKNRDIIPQLRENALKSIKQYPAVDVFSKIEKIIRENCGA